MQPEEEAIVAQPLAPKFPIPAQALGASKGRKFTGCQTEGEVNCNLSLPTRD